MTMYGLNKYQNNSIVHCGFRNFQWTLPGVLARSAQPDYTAGDAPHEFNFLKVDFLKKKKITCAISSNEYGLPAHSKTLLKTYGIAYYHFKLEDHQPLPPAELRSAAEIIEANCKKGATLVYCGYGQGRTGTIVAAWAMIKHMQARGANINAMCNLPSLKDKFGVEWQQQANNIRLAANLLTEAIPAQLALPDGVSPISLPPSGNSDMTFNVPSGMGLPTDTAFPNINFANFSSGSSDISW